MSKGGTLRVMLVDDHEFVRHAVAQALEAPDITVVAQASSGEAAVSLALGERPEVILLDIHLPGMSGIEVVRELAPKLPECKIVMLTVSATKMQVMEAIAAGAAGYLTKDLGPEALQRAVRGVRSGHLPMSRTLAASTLRHFSELINRVRASGGMELTGLSDRELQVLRFLSQGMTDRQIAALLVLSPRTVEKHVGTILRKLGVGTRAQAALVYLNEDLVGGAST